MTTSDLRILIVTDAVPGRNGVGTYFQDLTDLLRPQVAQIQLIAPRTEGSRWQRAALTMPGDPTQQLFLPRLRAFSEQFQQLQPHVVIVPGPGPFALAAHWLATRQNIPLCLSHQTDYSGLADLYWRGWKKRLAAALLTRANRWLIDGCSGSVTINPELATSLQAQGAPTPGLVGTPLAEQFLTSVSSADKGAAPLRSILFVGRLAAEKNLPAFLDLVGLRPDLQFCIAGDGPLAELVQTAVASHPNLRWEGWCDRSRVRQLLDEHDMLILPSHVEAFGTVALEALARQCRVMVSAHCGISQWSALKPALHLIDTDESLFSALSRAERMPFHHALQMAQLGRSATLTLQHNTGQQWLHQLQQTINRGVPTRYRVSATVSLLNRLAINRV